MKISSISQVSSSDSLYVVKTENLIEGCTKDEKVIVSYVDYDNEVISCTSSSGSCIDLKLNKDSEIYIC